MQKVASCCRNGARGGWSLPAGAIEPGESPHHALAREGLEETGRIVSTRRLIDVYAGADSRHTYPNADQVEYTVALYRCGVSGRGSDALDPETRSLCYVAAAERPALALPCPQDARFGGP